MGVCSSLARAGWGWLGFYRKSGWVWFGANEFRQPGLSSRCASAESCLRFRGELVEGQMFVDPRKAGYCSLG